MPAERRIFECTRCNHVALVYVDPPHCRKCGSRTGVTRPVDEETARRLLDQGEPGEKSPQ